MLSPTGRNGTKLIHEPNSTFDVTFYLGVLHLRQQIKVVFLTAVELFVPLLATVSAHPRKARQPFAYRGQANVIDPALMSPLSKSLFVAC